MDAVRIRHGLRALPALLALAAMLSVPDPAKAWIASGHLLIAEAAVRAVPDSMPPFFRAGFVEVGKSAMDPDFFRLRDLPQLRNAESPEHYLDVELLAGAEWPETRSRFIALVHDKRQDVYAVGTLPYALAEGVQKLAAGFAQVRLDPGDSWAQARVLDHAGIMAHYAADLCQPLHTTVHYNGRVNGEGASPQSGIHFRTDSLTIPVFAAGAPEIGPVERVPDLLAAIEREFEASHALVDRVYELEDGLGPQEVTAEAMRFAEERIQTSIRFTAALFVTAWELSEEISLPDWYRDRQPDPAPAPAPAPAAGGPSR